MDPKKILDELMKNPVTGGAVGGLAGGLLGSVLLGKGGKKLVGTAVKAGGLALVGTVAWKAWQQYQAKQGAAAGAGPGIAAPAALPAPFDLDRSPSAGLRVVQAMVAASKADGIVEAAERERITARTAELQLAADDRQFVLDLLDKPLDLDGVVRGIDTPELATEIYAASALAVHPANRVERSYLDMLAARLGLEAGLAGELDRSVQAALETR